MISDNPVKTVGLNYQFSLTSLVLWHFMKWDASHFSSQLLYNILIRNIKY